MDKIRKHVLIMIMLIMALSILGCNEKFDNEVVWYISDSSMLKEYEELENNQIIENDITKTVNNRIHELGIDAKVIFKYYPWYDDSVSDTDGFAIESLVANDKLNVNYPKRVLEKDRDADIVEFSSVNKALFLELDDYLKDENSKVFDAIIPKRIDANRVNGKVLYLPGGYFDVDNIAYCFNKDFINKYQIKLDPNIISAMTPRKVIEYFLPYFKDSRVIDGKNKLIDDLLYQYKLVYNNKYNILTRFHQNVTLLHDYQNNKILNYLDIDETKELFNLVKWIYDENIDAHLESNSAANLIPVFKITTMPSLDELVVNKDDNKYIEVPLGKNYVSRNVGTGVLKDSKQKELAVDVLCATMYDEELSNILTYGIEGKDYNLEDGYVEIVNGYQDDYRGSWSLLGNSLITYPQKNQKKNKKEIFEKIIDDAEARNNADFVPDLNEDNLNTLLTLDAILLNAESYCISNTVVDMDTYLNDLKMQFKEAGINELQKDLQEQLDEYLNQK